MTVCREARQGARARVPTREPLELMLSDADLDEIDALIAEGVFDSREAALLYFLRAGIESVPRVVDVEEPTPAAEEEALLATVDEEEEAPGPGSTRIS